MMCPCGCGADQGTMLALADRQFADCQVDIDRPAAVIMFTPSGRPCRCGCGAPAVEAAFAIHPYAFDDLSHLLPAMFRTLTDLSNRIGEHNFQMAELRRDHEAEVSDG